MYIRETKRFRNLPRYVVKHPLNAAFSVIFATLLAFVAWRFFEWAVLNSILNAQSMGECREIASGACWAVVKERGRLVIFGLYPQAEDWRVMIACVVFLGAAILSCKKRFQKPRVLVPLWVISFLLFITFMRGGVFGMPLVPQANWGGLALTFYIFASILIFGMPLAITFAIARHSGPKWAAYPVSLIVDLVRSIPITVILFFAALVLPTIVPSWLAGDKLWRIIGGFSVFFACYQAEILRGALQGLDRGQLEAADALGFSFWQKQLDIVFPQIFRTALPATVNQIVTAFKDTSYIAVVGFFDMTASASAALGTGEWATAYVEIYLVVGAIYLAFGYALSQYGLHLERRSDKAFLR